jgi:hypothetical protein
MVVVPGSLSPGGSCLMRATIPAQRSPGLGELVVHIGRVPGQEEDHVIAVAKRHELQTPKPDHYGQQERAFGVSHLEKCAGKRHWHTTSPTWRANYQRLVLWEP